jgi:ATP adenylyltransferase
MGSLVSACRASPEEEPLRRSPSMIGSSALRLKQFLETKMTMSHIYQPVMIRTILAGGGAATNRQIAAAIAAADLSQIEYCEHIISKYPGPVLRRHGVVEHENGIYRFAPDFRPSSEWERAELSAVCDLRVADFVARRQERLWSRRSNHDPLPGSVRWQVLSRALGRCEACGVSSAKRALEVDHIVPRIRGGTNDIWNLQALCSQCNGEKQHGDAIDFHAAHEAVKVRHEGCRLCKETAYKEYENDLAIVLSLPSGLVVAPRRHGVAYVDLWQTEVNALRQLEKVVSQLLVGATEMYTTMLSCTNDDTGHLMVSLQHPVEHSAQ